MSFNSRAGRTARSNSLSGHQSASMKSSDWLTPPEIIKALGCFDLDPCCPEDMPWRTAGTMLTKEDDGLKYIWSGRVWLNPPFGRQAGEWLQKLSRHGYGTALVAARTETKMFFNWVWPHAMSVLFLRGRPHFHYSDGTPAPFNSGAPICLVAYGQYDNDRLYAARGRLGAFVELNMNTGA